MKKLIVASNNFNKIREIKQILSKYPIEILSMKDVNLNVDIVEDGETFLENAYKKASTIYHILQGEYMVLADDSGLMVKGLNGAPGVHSARFAGEHGNDKKNNEKLLELLKDKKSKDKEAKFVCAMVLIVDSKRTFKVEGDVKGIICDEERGNNKFGYDPLFYVPAYHKTFGELPHEIKNSISHRANALKKLEERIKDIMEEV